MSDRSDARLVDGDPAALQNAFFAAFPRITRHAQIYFRDVKCDQTRDDAVAETVALAWKWFILLVRRGRRPENFISAIASYAARAAKSGRRLCGQAKANDAHSRQTHIRRGFTLVSILEYSALSGNPLGEALQDNTATPIPDQVSFRLDFPAWLATRSKRDRRLIGVLIGGERCQDAARRFHVSPARVAQLRGEYLDDWRSFCGEEVLPQ